jgi:peptide/nickel transport system ATP-binding protein
MPGTEPLLQIEGLEVCFHTPRGIARAVDGLSLAVRPGERVAIVGESGSGKSMTAFSTVGLVPPPGRIVAGSIRFRGRELVGLREAELAKVRGGEIGLIMQDPTGALDPLQTIGSQIAEGLRKHTDLSRGEARERALELIRQVQIGDPEQRVGQYAHQLSGGMNQRAMIAAAVGPEPSLLIADEPTSALDATTADGILELIGDLAREREMAVILITHDLGVVSKFAERVIVMYAGRVLEDGPVADVFRAPKHPYTRGLLESVPGSRGRESVKAIPGVVPDLTALPTGCVFHPRCALRRGRAVCETDAPALRAATDGRPGLTACHFAEELAVAPAPPAPLEVAAGNGAAEEPGGRPEILRVEDLVRHFVIRDRPFRKGGVVRAVDGINFSVRRGEVVALVGESGSGKSTAAKIILGLERPTAGGILFDGEDLAASHKRARELRRRIQVVFQNPDSSLDPRMRVSDIIAEPLNVHRIGTRREREERVQTLLEQVGLSAHHAQRYPYEFSGGQRQRIAIARALALRPDLLICDEPVTALDVSVQAQILNLLQRVQREEGLAYLFIAHDLAVVRQIADRVAVMYLGEIVEFADADDFFAQPRHPYSVALLSAMSTPGLDALQARERVILSGSIPSPFNPPPACRFHTRCWKVQQVCREVAPDASGGPDGRPVACHFPVDPATDPVPVVHHRQEAAPRG